MKTKPWYLSKGVLGSAGAVISGILGIWFVGIDAESITALLISSGTVATGFMALIGRLTAKTEIK